QSVSRANSLLKQFSFRRTRLAIALVVLAVTIAGALGIIQLVKHRTGRVPDFSKMRFTRLTTSGNTPLAALSPDGNYLAYVVADGPLRSLWIRQSTAANGVQINPPARVIYLSPAFTPDGTRIYYVMYELEKNPNLGVLYQMPALGGTPRKVLEDI